MVFSALMTALCDSYCDLVNFFISLICLFGGSVQAMVHLWRSEDSL